MAGHWLMRASRKPNRRKRLEAPREPRARGARRKPRSRYCAAPLPHDACLASINPFASVDIPPDMPKDGIEGQGPGLKALEMPPLVQALQRSYADFIEIFPDSKSTAQFRSEAASLSQRYLRFKEAEPRYVAILDNHCALARH